MSISFVSEDGNQLPRAQITATTSAGRSLNDRQPDEHHVARVGVRRVLTPTCQVRSPSRTRGHRARVWELPMGALTDLPSETSAEALQRAADEVVGVALGEEHQWVRLSIGTSIRSSTTGHATMASVNPRAIQVNVAVVFRLGKLCLAQPRRLPQPCVRRIVAD